MSYLFGLDEISERAIVAELVRRKDLRARGLCDYCERPPGSPACKFPSRHHRGLATVEVEHG